MNSQNNLFNNKIPSFKQKTSLKNYNLGDKISLYQNKNESQKFINSIESHLPNYLFSKKNSQNVNYKIFKSNNSIKYNENNNNLSKHINTSINRKKNQFNKNNNNNNDKKLLINNSNILKNYLKNSETKKNNTNFLYLKKNNKKNISHNQTIQNHKSKPSSLVNTYIINNLNISEKDMLYSRFSPSKHPKFNQNQKNNKEYENEINKLIKEKEESKDIIKKQDKVIKKIEEDNQILYSKIKNIENENINIKKKIEIYKENEEQLIMLVKIVQKSGVDVEQLIDKWNDEVENENNSNIVNIDNIDESITDSINELNSKISPSSFIPINIEKPNINKNIYSGIPKLNLDIIKNNSKNVKKEKFRNNSK